MEPTQRFFADRPESLREAIRHVAMLLEENPTFEIPFSGGNYGGTFHDALNIVQYACPKLDWVRKARVRWLEYGLAAWEESVSCNTEDPLYAPAHMRKTPLPLDFSEDTIRYFIEPPYVGEDYDRLVSRYLDLLQTVRYQEARPEYHRRWCEARMIRVLGYRTGCIHKYTPIPNHAAFDLFAEKYQLNITAAGLKDWNEDKHLRGT